MRTTLDIPEELIERAREATGLRSKTDLVVHALREVVRRGRVRELRESAGTWHVDVDTDRDRRRPPPDET